MSENKYSLKGKIVTLCLNGSWDFTGRVEFMDKDKIVLTSDSGPLVVYRAHIIAAMIIEERDLDESIDAKSPSEYNISMGSHTAPQIRKPIFDIHAKDDNEQENHYGSIIPNDMLIGEDISPKVSFSMSMTNLKNSKPDGERRYDFAKKDEFNRKKDSK